VTREGSPATYTIRSIQEMLGLSRGVIAGLIASGFVAPTRGPRNEYRFTFRDVVLLRTAVELKTARITPRKILGALRRLKATLPVELPLTGLRITAVGNDVTVREGHAQWQAESGQLVMDFEVAPAEGTVMFLRPDVPPEGEAQRAFGLGQALESSDPASAEVAYHKALALDPTLADAWLNLGALLSESGRHAEAAALSGEAVRFCPNEALLHFNRAIALEDLGKLAAALASYDACLRLEPDFADAHYNAARLHQAQGDARKALRHFSAYRRLSSKR
jgi:tetratricopeptide (TPR) repeat protein